ncbi:MAG: oligosaccharide flippase family protein [Actinomycetes bacterium]
MSATAAVRSDQTAEETSRSRRHFGNLLSGNLLNKGLRFVAAAVLARALTLDEFGVFNVGIAISGVLVVATSLGLPEIGTREVAVSPGQASDTAGRVVGGRLIAFLPVAIITCAIGSLAWPGHLEIFAAAMLMGLPMAAAADWLARGMEQMRVVGYSVAVGGAVTAIGSGALYFVGASATSALLVFGFAELVAASICWIAVRSSARPRIKLSGLSSMLRQSWPIALSSIAIYSYLANIDTIIMAGTRSTAEAGLYSGAYRLFLAFNMIPLFAAYAAFPIISRAAHEGRLAEARVTLSENRKDLLCFALVTIAIIELLGEQMLGLMFGAPFRAVAPTLVLLSAAVGWYSIGYPDGYSLVAEDRSRGFLAGAITASVLSLALDLLLIPSMGPPGAGLATTIAFLAAAAVWMLWRGRPDRSTVIVILLVAAASAGALLIGLASWSNTLIGSVTLAIALVGCVMRISQHRARRRKR